MDQYEILRFQVMLRRFLVINQFFQLSIQTELVVHTKTIKSHLKTNIMNIKFLHTKT